jgi:hypothetical protein
MGRLKCPGQTGAAQSMRWPIGNILIREFDYPAGWRVETCDDVDQGRLSSPVGTDQPDNFMTMEFEAHSI